MPHRFPNILFLVFLSLVIATPALIGRDEPGGDSLWGLDLEDVIGAGAAGLDALSKLWDFSTPPEDSTTPSGVPSEQPDEQRSETPDSAAFSIVEPTEPKTCAMAGESQEGLSDGVAVVKSWWDVEQEPETGRPVISACDLLKDNDDAYIVREIRFEEGRLKARWPAAILVSDPVNNVHFRYNVIRVGLTTTYTYKKTPIAVFVRKEEVVKLGYVRRRGWLVGVGAGVQQQSKEVALKWFEDEILAKTFGIDQNLIKFATSHFSAAWIAKAFAKADQSGSPYWISSRQEISP